jgi:hypothetical protein
VVSSIVSVARAPDQPPVWQHHNDRWRVRGVREDVEIVAIVQPGGEIVTAWPLAGGRGVVQNPEEM